LRKKDIESPADADIERVSSWPDALKMLDDEANYVVGGTLIGPWDEMHLCDDQHPDRHDWWLSARQAAREPDWLGKDGIGG
jgi:hypothetical protein